jgi:hypothetical protein
MDQTPSLLFGDDPKHRGHEAIDPAPSDPYYTPIGGVYGQWPVSIHECLAQLPGRWMTHAQDLAPTRPLRRGASPTAAALS